MSWVLVKQEAAGMGGTQLMAGGGGGAQVYLTPDRPITPEDAGMSAVDQYLSGRRFIAPDRAPDTTFLPQARQNIADTASRFARTAGKYGGLAAALGGGLKNLYDQTASGEPLSATSLGTGALAGYQFARPLATRAGAQLGTRVGVRQAENLQKPLTESQAAQPFAMPEQTDMGMFDAQPPASANYYQGRLAQPFNIPQGTDMNMFATPKPPTQIPSTSYQDFRNQIGIRPDMTLPPAQSPQIGTQPATPPDMSSNLQSSPAFTSATDAAMEQMKEQQKAAKEKKEQMEEEQREKLAESLKEQRDSSMGV